MVRGQILEVRRKVDTGLVTACHGPECNDAYQADMMQTTSFTKSLYQFSIVFVIISRRLFL